jgi:hypothetical protein
MATDRMYEAAADIKAGLLVLHSREDFARTMKLWPDGPVTVSVRPFREKRTSPQNRRYWALLTVAAHELGYDDPEDLHEGLALKFLGLPPDERTGLARRRRTPKTNTKEFSDYCDAVERYFLNDLHLDLSGWQDEAERDD